jgi:hypothetical protein
MRMKKLCLCVAATLAMVSCIPVDDFGTYWDKGVVDPALEGTWKNIGVPGSTPQERLGARELRFTRTGSFYTMNMVGIDPSMAPEVLERVRMRNARAGIARTLRLGKRRLLMERNREAPSDGVLTSYEIRGRTLSEYWFLGVEAVEFLETRHPGARNIHKNDGEGDFVVIGTFDDEVFRILSEVADSPTYWTLMGRYEKASN